MPHNFITNWSDLIVYNVYYNLKALTGQGVDIFGQVEVTVNINNRFVILPTVTLKTKHRFTTILGRNWLDILNPNTGKC